MTVNGAALTLGSGTGQAQFLPPGTNQLVGSLQFGTAPAANAVIDAVYPIDPSDPGNPLNLVSMVSLDLTLSATNPALGPSATQTTSLTSTASLRN